MIRGAADGPTGAAIDQALALPDGIAAHEAWNAIDSRIAAANGAIPSNDEDGSTPVISIADRIWPSQLASPDQEWVDLLAAYHGADVSTIDITRPEASRQEINAWVEDNTEGLIVDLLPPRSIDEHTTILFAGQVTDPNN